MINLSINQMEEKTRELINNLKKKIEDQNDDILRAQSIQRDLTNRLKKTQISVKCDNDYSNIQNEIENLFKKNNLNFFK